jgi:type IV pilus assembly protein PilM
MSVVQKKLVGIDIGTKNIKMVRVNRSGKITHHAYIDIPEGVIENGKIESREHLVTALRECRKKLKSSFKKCAICISSPDTVIRQIFLPVMDEESILPNIRMELSGFLPLQPDHYIIDYIITERIETDERRQFSITVFAIPAATVEIYLDCVKEAGFKVLYVDIMENAFEKLYKSLKVKQKVSSSNFACLYVDNSKSSVSIYGNNRLFINKVLDNGMGVICTVIAEKTGKPIEAVKRLLLTNDVMTYGETFVVEKSVVVHFIGEVASEVSRVIDYYKTRNRSDEIQTVFFSGGLSHVRGMKEYFETSLGIPVCNTYEITNSFFKTPPKNNTGIDYTNAIAITLREEIKK